MSSGEIVEQFPLAIRSLKRSLSILAACESELAAAAIAMKLVDVIGSIINNQMSDGIAGLWQCSYVIMKIVYGAVSEKLGKCSKRAVAAECAREDENFRAASEEYAKACLEITSGTGLEVLFKDA